MRFNFFSAIWASILATIVMTIVMYFLDMNIMVALGMTAGVEGPMILIVGGFIHLCVGVIFGFIYALIFEPLMKRLPGFLAGAIYSLIPFFVAIFFMAPFLQSIEKIFGAEGKKPVMKNAAPQPQELKTPQPGTSAAKPQDETPQVDMPAMPPQDVPTQSDMPTTKPQDTMQPGAPTAKPQDSTLQPSMQKAKPSVKLAPQNPNNSKKGGGMAILWSLVGYLVYGIILGWAYRPRIKKTEG
ncbi:MAG: hypothetical protein KR126chlam3_00452 [Chlamydiae bacterium]|nr:hypothetical protein [Chlamydiota bacterium]